MKSSVWDFVVTAAGILLAGAGLFLRKAVPEPQGVLLALPYLCVGLGCGAFGHGLGGLISGRAVKNRPNLQKQQKIDQNDERNQTITNRAKARAFNFMTYLFGALMLSFALMGVDLVAVLLLVFSFLLVQGYGIYYRFKYEGEM